LFTLVPLAIIVIYLGVYPAPVLNLLEVTMNNLIVVMKEAPTLWGMQ
jgi:NADH:ubiquinone oxidoreductase subunit 4 (subunit M)